jgi:hypothetical protein
VIYGDRLPFPFWLKIAPPIFPSSVENWVNSPDCQLQNSSRGRCQLQNLDRRSQRARSTVALKDIQALTLHNQLGWKLQPEWPTVTVPPKLYCDSPIKVLPITFCVQVDSTWPHSWLFTTDSSTDGKQDLRSTKLLSKSI